MPVHTSVVPPVVCAEWLHQQITSCVPDICVLDCSWSSTKDMAEEFKITKHIPTAVHFNAFHQTIPSEMYPRPVPDTDVMQDHIRALGVNSSSHVVLYDNNGQCGFFIASRAWWTLKYLGLTKVSVLNGGMSKWIKDGYDTTTDIPVPKLGDFTVAVTPSFRALFTDMDENLKTLNYQVVDTRPNNRYTGEDKECSFGHYPAAVNLPFGQKLLDQEKGVLRSEEEIKQALADAGVDFKKPIVSTCNSGMSSSTLVLAAHMLGIDAKLYVTGMTEWSKKRPESLVRSDTPT